MTEDPKDVAREAAAVAAVERVEPGMTLGLGSGCVRAIPIDRDYRMRVEPLVAAIERDRTAGVEPAIVIAQAGSVNTGLRGSHSLLSGHDGEVSIRGRSSNFKLGSPHGCPRFRTIGHAECR